MDTIESSRIEHEFMIQKNENLQKYQIDYLPRDRFNEAMQLIKEYFLPDAPVSQIFDGAKNPLYVEDFLRPCRIQMSMGLSLICCREGSDEILGLALNYISRNGSEKWQKADSAEFKVLIELGGKIAANVNTFEKYDVNEYLETAVLVVLPKHRGLGIGKQLLLAGKKLCKKFDLKVTQAVFSSNYSNRIADQIGYVTDVAYNLTELSILCPKFDWKKCNTQQVAIKTWIIDEEHSKNIC